MQHNRGIDLEREGQEQLGTEWQFGASSQACIAFIPMVEREKYLPIGEVQRGAEDFMDCVTRTYMDLLESKFTYLYTNNLLKPETRTFLEQNDYVEVATGRVTFSDRFTAVKSGTTRQGNSLKAPADSVHRDGLIPKCMLPKQESMTFDQYHDKSAITQEMEELGKKFLTFFDLNYEQVSVLDLDMALDKDMVNVAAYAWPTPINNEYPPQFGLPFNHSILAFKTPKTYIFDHYLDNGMADDYIKKLAPGYIFYPYGYRLYVGAEKTPSPLATLPETQKIPLFTWLAKMIAWLFTKTGPMPEIPKEILPEKPVEKPTVPVKESKLDNWTDAIEFFESGGDKDAQSYRRNNPGNIKGTDGKFLVFQTYEAGRAHLMNYLIRAATNQHEAYVRRAAQLKKNSSGALTIREFVEVYTFGDSAEIQKNYAACIARYCNATPETEIRNLL